MKASIVIALEVPATSLQDADDTARRKAAQLGPTARVESIHLTEGSGRTVMAYYGEPVNGSVETSSAALAPEAAALVSGTAGAVQ